VKDPRPCTERFPQCVNISLKESYNKSTDKVKRVQGQLTKIIERGQPDQDQETVKEEEKKEEEKKPEKKVEKKPEKKEDDKKDEKKKEESASDDDEYEYYYDRK
jgi:hypothetical protein